jgi:hypothetical protein
VTALWLTSRVAAGSFTVLSEGTSTCAYLPGSSPAPKKSAGETTAMEARGDRQARDQQLTEAEQPAHRGILRSLGKRPGGQVIAGSVEPAYEGEPRAGLLLDLPAEKSSGVLEALGRLNAYGRGCQSGWKPPTLVVVRSTSLPVATETFISF